MYLRASLAPGMADTAEPLGLVQQSEDQNSKSNYPSHLRWMSGCKGEERMSGQFSTLAGDSVPPEPSVSQVITDYGDV